MRAVVETQKDLPLLEPEPAPLDPLSRCKREPKAEAVLRARKNSGSDSVDLEVGAFLSIGEKWVVIGTRSAGETTAFVAVGGPNQSFAEVALGRLLGAVELPVAVQDGDAVVAMLRDSDASGQRMRLLRLEVDQKKPQVTWGPEFSVPLGGSGTASIAVTSDHAALVTWDQNDPRGGTRVMGMSFDAQTLKESSKIKTLSGSKEDAEQARVVSSGSEFLVAYTRLVPPKNPPDDQALVVEPDRTLVARRVDRRATAHDEPLIISESGEHVLASDVAAEAETFFFAYRATTSGRSIDESSITWARLAADGSLIRGQVAHQDLGPGAPLLLPPTKKGAPWVFARGKDAETLLWDTRDESAPTLHIESELADQIPLARSVESLISMKPLGLDWELARYDCSGKPH